METINGGRPEGGSNVSAIQGFYRYDTGMIPVLYRYGMDDAARYLLVVRQNHPFPRLFPSPLRPSSQPEFPSQTIPALPRLLCGVAPSTLAETGHLIP